MGLRTTVRTFFWERVGAYPVNIRGERFVCHPRQCAVWRKWAAGRREGGALNILTDRLSKDSALWDIGAHVGLMTLYAARKCERVVCFEPDPAALQYLSCNIARNRLGNVSLVGAGLAAKTGFRRMGAADGKLGTGHTGFYAGASASAACAPCLGPEVWGPWLESAPPDFLKMDIEGASLNCCPRWRTG